MLSLSLLTLANEVSTMVMNACCSATVRCFKFTGVGLELEGGASVKLVAGKVRKILLDSTETLRWY